ncbi:MAG: hypothetical protein V1914_04375 [archaeon]
MQKRGQFEVLQISFLFEVVIAVAIAALLIYSVVSFDVFSKFKKEYADADLTLLMDQIVSAPGAVQVNYPLSSKYQVTIDSGVVKIDTSTSFDIFSDSYLILSKDPGGNLDVRRINE